LCRRRRAGFSVDEAADPRGWFVKRLAGSGVVQGLYQGWFTPLGHSVRGCFVIRFPARRRLDDRKHAISGVFRPIPSDRPSLCPRIAPYHLLTPNRGSEGGLTPKRDARAELYPLLRVVMEGRRLEYRVCQSSAPSGFVGWASTAQCSPLSRAVSRDQA
jgi:hypothetical protein